MIREANGSVTAHTWSTGAQEWVNVGTVVDSAGSSGNKQEYLGKDYDYVFDVDIEDGKPPLKLPYNSGESPWDAARKFLEKNELPMSYYEQVANWISDNTKGTRIGQDAGSASAPPPQARDPWGRHCAESKRACRQVGVGMPPRPISMPSQLRYVLCRRWLWLLGACAACAATHEQSM